MDDSDDYYYMGNASDEYDDTSIPADPIVRISAVIVIGIYIMAFTIGIPANIYVLFRMHTLAKNDNERYRNGTGVALCSMAAADLCSLLLICAQNVHTMIAPTTHSDTPAMHAMCKTMLFLTHTVTGISIWSWLLLSCLRYLAICHPLYHLRLWQMPCRALVFIVTMSLILNAWLLVAVESGQYGCTQMPLIKKSLTANRLFHIVECVWSFCIPCAVIIVMDTSVVVKSTTLPRLRIGKSRRKSALEEIIKLTRSNSNKIKTRHQRALWKWLIIALVCILLNTPENTYRLIMLFGMPDVHGGAVHYAARIFAQALYFSQFAFNAIYLAVFVYDKSSRSKHVQDGSNFNSHTVLQPMRSRVSSTNGSPRPRPHTFCTLHGQLAPAAWALADPGEVSVRRISSPLPLPVLESQSE